MLTLPAGSIELRDDRVQQKWKVDLKAYQLSPIPVTQELYETVMGENPSAFKGDKRPVETVSWMDAIRFCNQLSERLGLATCYRINAENDQVEFDSQSSGFRLPTEAEWQYACQTGDSAIRYGKLDDIAWYKDNSNQSPQEVGLKLANDWGLYDMLGNVWEWCNDIYDETVYGSYRIFRGGGWSDLERGVLATNRRRSHPVSFKIDDLGFRVARNVE
ncbi:SUMF1/EgtB/PvdO family nonheme iron enzyme [bacterium SCSIO 12741]|nr:SUMF1/EgtB/PvdO family nonheme iron enzyme [bacterium SCSIO 12741]